MSDTIQVSRTLLKAVGIESAEELLLFIATLEQQAEYQSQRFRPPEVITSPEVNQIRRLVVENTRLKLILAHLQFFKLPLAMHALESRDTALAAAEEYNRDLANRMRRR